MISKTFVTAVIATCLMAGSSASPCKVSSRTSEASTTADASTTTALSSIALSSTEQLSVTVTVSESSIGTTLATTTIVSSSQDSSVADSTSTEAESAMTSNESVATTTDDTTTAVPITTTAEAPSTPTFIVNTGFEDSSESLSPWSIYVPNPPVTLSLDTSTSHDGQNSAHLSYAEQGGNGLQQKLQGPIMADVTYAMSAWVRTSIGCHQAHLECQFGGLYAEGQAFELDPDTVNDWQLVSTTCTFTPDQVDSGNLRMLVAFSCRMDSDAYVDTVSFTV